MNQPKVAVIVVNWNGLGDTAECLESLKKIIYPNYEVVVIDNGSDGNDGEALAEQFGDYIYLIKTDMNYGGSGGYNIGMRHVLANSDAEYLLILDNDVVVAPDFLSEMVNAVEADSSVGFASAMVYHYDEPERLHLVGEKVNLWKVDIELTLGLIMGVARRKILKREDIYRGRYDSMQEVWHIGFWCALFRRRNLESVGLLAEGCRGFESVDYFMRVRESGSKVVYVPKAKVWHKFRSTKRIDGSFQYYGCSGLFRFMKRYATEWQYRCFLFQFFGIHFWLATAYYLIWHRRPRVLLGFYRGVRDGLFSAEKPLREEG